MRQKVSHEIRQHALAPMIRAVTARTKKANGTDRELFRRARERY